ncbi:unnamed protein product [Pleuronectes platessa]|uniref:Uncharacterized protein n=1 Tax=Pleuronectes platessa TaxID=8262 RepID=A0A9N7UM63_PLEPL|nr:unnamed protein product [Pleuronectes platessa]
MERGSCAGAVMEALVWLRPGSPSERQRLELELSGWRADPAEWPPRGSNRRCVPVEQGAHHRAAKLLHGLIDFMPSSHIYSHLSSDSPPPPPRSSSSSSSAPLPMAMVHLGNRQLSRKWEAAPVRREDLP